MTFFSDVTTNAVVSDAIGVTHGRTLENFAWNVAVPVHVEDLMPLVFSIGYNISSNVSNILVEVARLVGR